MLSTCLRACHDVAIFAALFACCGGCVSRLHTDRAGGASLKNDSTRNYVCRRSTGDIVVDGRLDEEAWVSARRTERFVDIEGAHSPRPRFTTHAKMLWDDQFFYIGAAMEEPHVWATLTEPDSVVYHDNDFEVFMDPDRDGRMYYEIEINALRTIFDLLLEKTYKEGGPARHGWNMSDLHAAVHIDGTLNDPRDRDTGWSVEMALPWASLAEYANTACPPNEGDIWWVNFSRVQWRSEVVNDRYRKTPTTSEDNWVWSPQGVIDMHIPDRWGRVTFTLVPK